jgi:CheY-like chemotaxis protein
VDDYGDIEMKPKLLIVDDDVTIMRQLFWMLCDEFDVLMAHDLQTAIRRVTVYEPDVALLDLHLPPMENSPDAGLRILEYVKGHFPSSKVFVTSSAASADVQKDCLRKGADGFLPKPLDVETLLSTLRASALAEQLSFT